MMKSINVKAESVQEIPKTEEEQWIDEWYLTAGEGVAEAVRYQIGWDCDFLVYVDMTEIRSGTYKLRNMDMEQLEAETEGIEHSEEKLFYEERAYVADAVVDTYIREYGGENTVYRIKEAEGVPNGDHNYDFMEVCAGDTEMLVLWGLWYPIASVRILGEEGKQVSQKEEFIAYFQCNRENSEQLWDLTYNLFYMVCRPEPAGNSLRYRNIKGGIAGRKDCYLAEQIIDTYIREYQGSDSEYTVWTGRILNPLIAHGTQHILMIHNEDATLLAEYSDDSRLVRVEIQNGEIILREEASQEDIDRAGRRTNLKRLQFWTEDESLNLRPLTELRELEELHIEIHAEAEGIDLSPIGELKHLKVLAISGCVPDFSFLKDLDQLEEVHIRVSSVENLSFFSNMRNLKKLYVSKIMDADLSSLKELQFLEELSIKGHHIRNIECLEEMQRMRKLYLYEREIDTKKREWVGIEAVGCMQELDTLYLVMLNVEDFTPLSQLSVLEELTLVDTGIGDLQFLSGLKDLKKLGIYGKGSTALEEQVNQYCTGVESIMLWDQVTIDFR